MLAQAYDLRGTLTPLDAEYDVNLRVDSERGAFLLKILRAGSEAGFAEMQIAALEHLQQRAPDLLVQRVQRTNQGALHTTLRDDSDNDRVCWVTTYLPGRLLAASEVNDVDEEDRGLVVLLLLVIILVVCLSFFESSLVDDLLL